AQADNTIMDDVESYIDSSTVKATAGQVMVRALTPSTSSITSDALAVSISAGLSVGGAALSGGGAGATNTITNTVKAYIAGSPLVQSVTALQVLVTANDNATIDSSVGAYAFSFGVVGVSIGVSVQDNSVNDTVTAYINAPVTVTNGGIQVLSESTVSVTG